MFLGRGMRLFVSVPDLGWLFLMGAAGAIAPLALYLIAPMEEGLIVPQ